MTLGESPKREYDIGVDIQKNPAKIRIPIDEIDISALTFTFPDSMYQIILDANGNFINGGRTNTPTVYLYNEIEDVMKTYRDYLSDHYIEAQVWNREMLLKYYTNDEIKQSYNIKVTVDECYITEKVINCCFKKN